MKRAIRLMVAVCFFLGFTKSHAGLLGSEVGIQYLGPDSTVVRTVTVGAGEEGNFFGNQFFDFDDFSFSIRSTGNFCGIFVCAGPSQVSLLLTDLNFGAPLTSVAISSVLSGVNVAFGSNFAKFTWLEQDISVGTYLSARFNVGAQQVPEPASLALLGIGIAGLVALRRRKAA